MTKPEEKLRDRIAEVVKLHIEICRVHNVELQPEALAQSIIDEILKPQLEFISNDTVPVEGDLLRIDSWVHTAVSREIYADMGKLYGKRAHFIELDCIADFDDKEQLKWIHEEDEGNMLIQHNNKNTFNVDKLEVKGE